MELVLRLAGFGYPTGFFRTESVNGKRLVVPNDQFSRRFFPEGLARRPLPSSFEAAKPPGTYRIFVMGESAAMGDPEPAFAFSRILEVLLRDRFPEGRVEVINVAFTAINSHVILPIAQACAEQAGDLWVVYMGHNEVHGPFGPGTVFGGHRSRLWLTRAALAFKTTRVGQGLDALQGRLSARDGRTRTWQGLEMFLGHQFRKDDPRLASMYSQFRENLEDIIRTGRESGADIILCSPASNLKDSPPFASLHRSGFAEEQKKAWERLYEPAAATVKAGRHQEGFGFLQSAAELDPQFAELHFLIGRCLAAMDRKDEARSRFELARDLDSLRFRADSRLSELIKEVASAWRDKGVFLCNTTEGLAQGLVDRIPGEESFFDHVHLTFDGNYLIARTVADQAALRLPAELRRRDAGIWASANQCAARLGLTSWHEYQMFQAFQRRLLEAPFTNQLNHVERQARVLQKLAELRPSLSPAGLEEAARVCREALTNSPQDPVLHESLGRVLAAKGEPEAALAEFQRVKAAWPHHPAAYHNIGLLLQQLRRDSEAEAYFQQALARRPDFADAHNGLGSIQAGRGELDQAVRSFQQALTCNPELVEADVNLGHAWLKQGKDDQAEERFREALRRRPQFAPAHLGLADLLLKNGKTFEAIPHLSAAAKSQPEATLTRVRSGVQAQPSSALEHFKLANILGTFFQTNQAVQHLESAVQLKPDFWEARYLLGVELAAQGKLPEAQQQFSKVIELRPDYARAHLNLGVALAQQRRFPEAAMRFQEVLRLDSTNQSARQYLKMIQAMTQSNPPADKP